MNKKEIRAQKIAEMNAISAKGVDITEEEKRSFDQLDNEVQALSKEIEAEERASKANGYSTSLPVAKTEETSTSEETRAANFVSSGKFESRAVLGTGTIAKPVKADGISGLAAVADSIVDDVHAVALTGNGSYVVGYKVSDAVAATVTDGSAIGGTASSFNTVTIQPAEWGVLDTVSKQVKKMTPLSYLNEVEKSALIALRTVAANKIVTAVTASSLAQAKTYALDETYIRKLVLGFRSIAGKGNVCLYLAQADLITLGSVRGTNEKKAVYEIEFNAGNTTSGIIRDGGTAVPFRVIDELTSGTQLFGQPGTIDMPMWDNYEISTDESVYFDKNLIAVRGLQTANADLVAKNGMQVISNS